MHEKGILKREKSKNIINPNDEIAIQWGLKLKSAGYHTSVISMGPAQAQKSVEYVLALGIDAGYLVSDKYFAGSDTLSTAKILGETVKYLNGADILLLGHQSYDGDTGQVPSQLGEILNIQSFTNVDKLYLEQEKITIFQNLDAERIIETQTPVLISFSIPKQKLFLFPLAKDFFEPKKVTVITNKELSLDYSQIGLNGSATKVIKMNTPVFTGRKKLIQHFTRSSVKEIVSQLLK